MLMNFAVLACKTILCPFTNLFEHAKRISVTQVLRLNFAHRVQDCGLFRDAEMLARQMVWTSGDQWIHRIAHLVLRYDME